MQCFHKNANTMLRLTNLLLFCLFFHNANSQLIPITSEQHFALTNKVTMTDLKHSSNEETSYTFESLLKIRSVWSSNTEQLLAVYFLDSTVKAPRQKGKSFVTQKITTIPDRPFYITLLNGKPSKVIAHTSRDQSLLNLERGIASLLQLQNQNGPVREVDSSGTCTTFYNRKSSTRVEKTKTDCGHWDLHVSYRAEKPLSVTQNSQEHVEYELSADGMLLKATSTEKHRVVLEAKTDVGSQVESVFEIKNLLENIKKPIDQMNFVTLDEAINSLLEWYRVFDIESDVDGVVSEIKDITLKDSIDKKVKLLSDKHIGHDELAVAIAELLPLARITKQQEFVNILKSHEKLYGQLVDLLAAAQTSDAHNAINEVFKYNKKSDEDFLEKYLQSLAVGTHPDRYILVDLYARLTSKDEPIKNSKLYDTVLQTLATLTRQTGLELSDELIIHIRNFITSELEKCKDAACKTRFIRALQNLQDASTIDILINSVLEGDAYTSVAAMQALRGFPVVYFKEEQRKLFEQIFYQLKRQYDTSARIFALDILLSLKPTKEQLGNLLDYLTSNDKQFEIKTYVIQKLHMLAEKCPRFNVLLKDCLAERPHVNNYNTIAQKGLTTVLTRQLSTTPAFNESLLSIQEINKGVLKRGSVELILTAGREETTTFKLGIYTSGLSSFVSEDTDDEEVDDSPASAGMEISVQGVILRPLVFFTGNSELMGHVWSGTASDPTPAYQSTTVTHDHEHYIILASGATVFIRIIGAKSVDLNGKVNFSIWNRNAETEIKQNTGAAIVGVMAVGFTYAQLENHFIVQNEPKISLDAKIDFYSDIKLCMQLQRPEMILKHSNKRSIELKAGKAYRKQVSTTFTHKSFGRTLALNQKNNDMCNMINE
ncbi:microsomal triglyceride transfer protein large subunit [Teleopsis dalmanni]|uniref:microsomal triglyceride transfer protein large subunit n=1 Tax=Teleopsis dalmanni TaxID=139649 RepID=UPI0018CF729C|nr:microsomal triglyceride transfer protein large subunit [Teleopsis dalmanni]